MTASAENFRALSDLLRPALAEQFGADAADAFLERRRAELETMVARDEYIDVLRPPLTPREVETLALLASGIRMGEAHCIRDSAGRRYVFRFVDESDDGDVYELGVDESENRLSLDRFIREETPLTWRTSKAGGEAIRGLRDAFEPVDLLRHAVSRSALLLELDDDYDAEFEGAVLVVRARGSVMVRYHMKKGAQVGDPDVSFPEHIAAATAVKRAGRRAALRMVGTPVGTKRHAELLKCESTARNSDLNPERHDNQRFISRIRDRENLTEGAAAELYGRYRQARRDAAEWVEGTRPPYSGCVRGELLDGQIVVQRHGVVVATCYIKTGETKVWEFTAAATDLDKTASLFGFARTLTSVELTTYLVPIGASAMARRLVQGLQDRFLNATRVSESPSHKFENGAVRISTNEVWNVDDILTVAARLAPKASLWLAIRYSPLAVTSARVVDGRVERDEAPDLASFGVVEMTKPTAPTWLGEEIGPRASSTPAPIEDLPSALAARPGKGTFVASALSINLRAAVRLAQELTRDRSSTVLLSIEDRRLFVTSTREVDRTTGGARLDCEVVDASASDDRASVVVDPSVLLEHLERFSGTVRLQASGSSLVITGESGATATTDCFGREFLNPFVQVNLDSLVLPTAVLSQALDSVLYAAPRTVQRISAMGGVFIDGRGSETVIVASDGQRTAIAKLATRTASSLWLHIPFADTLRELVRHGVFEDLRWSAGESADQGCGVPREPCAVHRWSGTHRSMRWTFTVQSMDVSRPNYASTIPQLSGSQTECVLQAVELRNQLQRVVSAEPRWVVSDDGETWTTGRGTYLLASSRSSHIHGSRGTTYDLFLESKSGTALVQSGNDPVELKRAAARHSQTGRVEVDVNSASDETKSLTLIVNDGRVAFSTGAEEHALECTVPGDVSLRITLPYSAVADALSNGMLAEAAGVELLVFTESQPVVFRRYWSDGVIREVLAVIQRNPARTPRPRAALASGGATTQWTHQRREAMQWPGPLRLSADTPSVRPTRARPLLPLKDVSPLGKYEAAILDVLFDGFVDTKTVRFPSGVTLVLTEEESPRYGRVFYRLQSTPHSFARVLRYEDGWAADGVAVLHASGEHKIVGSLYATGQTVQVRGGAYEFRVVAPLVAWLHEIAADDGLSGTPARLAKRLRGLAQAAACSCSVSKPNDRKLPHFELTNTTTPEANAFSDSLYQLARRSGKPRRVL